jgi:hypothetical protein
MISALVIGAGCFAALQSRINGREPEADGTSPAIQQNI